MADKRSMAPMSRVREYWNMPYGICFRCGRNAQVVRGHVIAHSAGGSGDVKNLVPICALCNKLCPPWWPEDEKAAWAWMRMDAGEYWYEMTKDANAKETARWIEEHDTPGTDASQMSLPEFIDAMLRAFALGVDLKSRAWLEEIRTNDSTR